MGRPTLGISHVDSLAGSEEEKGRLKLVLQTLSGEMSVAEASFRLGISESRFAELRSAALAGALAALAPRPPGRPRKVAPPNPGEVETLRRRVKDLELDLACACVKTEVALVMPHLLVRGSAADGKKGGPQRTGKGRNGTSSDGISAG